MDVVILALNSKYIHSSLAPWYLKSAVSDLNIKVSVLEHTVNEQIESVMQSVQELRPSVLAISVYIWNVEYAFALAERIKSVMPDIKIVFGGPEVSYNSSEVIKNSNVDYVLCGEGEVPFFNLCRILFFGEQAETDGITFAGSIASPYVGIGTPKSPYTDEYFKQLNGRIAYFESSRGCPYSCAYCLSGRCEPTRFFDMEYVKENLLKLAQSGTKTVKFVDRTFNADKKRAREILSFILQNIGTTFPSDVCFHFELSAFLIDDETVELLRTAPRGLFQFEIGIQSFYDKTVRAIHRNTDSEVLKCRIKQLVAMGNAHIHTDLIAGLPNEDYDSFVDSFNQAYLLGADMLQLGFLKILHGTELEARAEEYGFKYSALPPYEVHETRWITADEIVKLKVTEAALDRVHNSGRFKRTIALCLPKFKSPYNFFFEIGKIIKDSATLDELTDTMYFFLCERFPEMSERLRDEMVCDRLSTNSSRGLPSALYRADYRIKEVKKYLNSNANTKEKPNVRRSIAILYSLDKAVYVDYGGHRAYRLNFIDLGEVFYETN